MNIDQLVEDILFTHKAKEVEKKFNFKNACMTAYGYLFIDSEDGQCYLFDKNGKMDDVKKMKALYLGYVKKDIKKIVIPDSVKNIGFNAFYDCTSLTNIEIPESVKSIEKYTFYNCTSLKSIEIPKSVESIGFRAFWNCTSLEEVIFKGKTMDQAKRIVWYPWNIKDEAIIKCS